MATTTTALVCHERGAIPSLEQVEVGGIRHDEVLVQMHATGICHTDISCMNGVIPAEFPCVLGHEGAGVILEVGSEIRDLHPGDKQYVNMNFGGRRADGSQPVQLPNGTKLFSNFFGQSSFSRVAVANGRTVVKVPESTNLPLFASLGCGIQTGVGTVLNTLNTQPGQSLAVFGVGTVGLASVMGGKLAGANPIIALDIDQRRLDLAMKLGATHAVLTSDKTLDPVEEINTICSGKGVARAVDCSGVRAAIEQMIQSLGCRGKAATVGSPAPGETVRVDVFNHIVKGTHYIGSCEGDCAPSEMIPYLIQQHSEGRFPLEELLTYYDVKDYKKALEDLKLGKVVKAILLWT